MKFFVNYEKTAISSNPKLLRSLKQHNRFIPAMKTVLMKCPFGICVPFASIIMSAQIMFLD